MYLGMTCNTIYNRKESVSNEVVIMNLHGKDLITVDELPGYWHTTEGNRDNRDNKVDWRFEDYAADDEFAYFKPEETESMNFGSIYESVYENGRSWQKCGAGVLR